MQSLQQLILHMPIHMGLPTFENAGHHIENEFTSWSLNGIEKCIHSIYAKYVKKGSCIMFLNLFLLQKVESYLSWVHIGVCKTYKRVLHSFPQNDGDK